MAKKKNTSLVTSEVVEQSILLVRGHKVLLDSDLAQLYGVETKVLLQATKRNIQRFPDDFMFQLSKDEWAALRSQIGTLNLRSQIGISSVATQAEGSESIPTSASGRAGRGRHRKYRPYAFTEQGVAMLSSVLRSPRAVKVNIEIMRAFVRLRKVLAVNAELAQRLDELESRVGTHDEQFLHVIEAIRRLMDTPADPKRRRIGFHHIDEDSGGAEPKETPKSAMKRRPRPERARSAARRYDK